MACLPEDIRPYFEALHYIGHGMEGLLPACRVENQAFLLDLHAALELELRLTEPDKKHLHLIMAMAERVGFPPMRDVKSYCEAEGFLMRACPQFPKKRIRLALQWAFLLLARHGRVEADLATINPCLQIWRKVQTFHSVEQGFMADFIRWMERKSFSPRSMADIIREARKLTAWMRGHGIDSLDKIGNLELQRYLLDRACSQSNASKQKILGNLKASLHYYQEAIDGCYRIPDYTVKAPRLLGVNASASSEEIERLWEALEAERVASSDETQQVIQQTLSLSPAQGLMLVLVIGYGLQLKILPLLEPGWEPGILSYTDRQPSRRGERERIIQLDLSVPWIAHYWQAYMTKREAGDYPYLFISGHGQRRKRPVSVDSCQRTVQVAVQSVLGYPIPVNHLERGALKRLARLNSLTHFMILTAGLPKSRLARMMYWLAC
jgi:hypothetical protein